MRLVDGRDPRVIFGVVVPLYIYAYISNVQYRGTLYVGHMFHLTTCLDDIKLPFVLMTPRSNIIYIYIYIVLLESTNGNNPNADALLGISQPKYHCVFCILSCIYLSVYTYNKTTPSRVLSNLAAAAESLMHTPRSQVPQQHAPRSNIGE